MGTDEPLNRYEVTADDEVLRFYRGQSEYFNQVSISSNSLLVNWLFALNTGSLAGILAFISSDAGKTLLKCNFIFCISVMMLFALGIICIYLSLTLEKLKFNKKGEHIDVQFDKFQRLEITASQFIDNVTSYSPYNCWCKSPVTYEGLSSILWVIGLILFAILLLKIPHGS